MSMPIHAAPQLADVNTLSGPLHANRVTPAVAIPAVTIGDCVGAQRAAWNAFVDNTPAASFYHRYEWREVNRECFGHDSAYLAAFDNDRIVGVYPIAHVNSWMFGSIACSLPFVNYGGPCGYTDQIERELIEAGNRVADRWKVDYLEIRARKRLDHDLPTSEHKVSMTLDLAPNPDDVFNSFSRTHRKDIRRGYKQGFEAKCGGIELLDDFYAVLTETWRDAGTPIYSKSYIEKVLATFPQHTGVTVVYANGEAAAAAIDGFQSGIGEGLWLGARQKFKRDMVGYVLYWEVLKCACERGLTKYHLGRSTAGSGAETFKQKWNATATQLYWQYYLRNRPEIPQLNVNNGRFRMAIDVWQKLPVGLTKLIGPFISRNIP